MVFLKEDVLYFSQAENLTFIEGKANFLIRRVVFLESGLVFSESVLNSEHLVDGFVGLVLRVFRRRVEVEVVQFRYGHVRE